MKCDHTLHLSDICDYVKDKIAITALNRNNYVSTENMLANKAGIVRASSLPAVAQTQAFLSGDVLVSNIRPYFKKIWFAKFDGGCSNDVLVFRAKEGVSSRFLYYVLANDSFFAYSTATSKGTKMPRGDKTAIMGYEVPKITPEEQEKITAILSALDDKIELNNKINANLEQQAQALFKAWFVDFEPFGGKMPEDWRRGTIADLGMVVGGSTPSKSKAEYYTENGIAWITPKDLSVNKEKFIFRGENDITELGLKNCSVSIMPEGTVLFSSRAPIGYIAIAAGEVTTNQGFKSVVPNRQIGAAYVYYFLKSSLSIIEGMASGSTFKEISGSTMKQVPALIPDPKILSKFNRYCEALFAQQRIVESQNRLLSSLRDCLLPKLMLGDLFNWV